MKLKNVSFKRWEENHEGDHPAKWFRSLYPFRLFALIDFSREQLAIPQRYVIGGLDYTATLIAMSLQDNSRWRANFRVTTHAVSKTGRWKHRAWDAEFSVVFTEDWDFITVFSKKQDPTKDLVARFMSGRFDRVALQKSMPLSAILIKTLIVNVAEQLFPGGSDDVDFAYLPEGVRRIEPHSAMPRKSSTSFPPLYSVGRDLWVCYSFSEEKAHRLAFYMANQCRRLFVVYVNPTPTRHHRCACPDTNVVSLFEFARRLGDSDLVEYLDQIRFLQNHLNPLPREDAEVLLKEINQAGQASYEIRKSELMEGMGIMKLSPETSGELFYFLAAMNLINAWVNGSRKRSVKRRDDRLFKDMYFFKSYLSKVLSTAISQRLPYVDICVEADLVIVQMLGFQFSFHAVKKDRVIKSYEASPRNQKIEWSGRRLQPVAPLVLRYAREMLARQRDADGGRE